MRVLSEQATASRRHLVVEVFCGLLCLFVVVLLLVPIVFQDRGSHRSLCISNLKQTMTGQMMYLADNNDTAPPSFTFDGETSERNFFAALKPYVKDGTVYLCPFDKDQRRAGPFSSSREGIPGLNSYVHCLSLRERIPDFATGKRLLVQTSIPDVASFVLLRDPIRGTAEYQGRPVLASPNSSGFAVGFFDGHVKSLMDIREKGAL